MIKQSNLFAGEPFDTRDRLDLLPADDSLPAPTFSTLRDVSRANVDLPDVFLPKCVTGVDGA